ncbi:MULTISPECIES: hypothetical protein [unclassified Mesorhizobium]|uniref:hypothetical protein n=1 Tax=unclassified Mesorhizobium TaxID=325217 RepID=UPI00112CF239|nr:MULTISPECIES: hypothetical protein [unclassified Mesorhizobium]TPJ39709.1 hypothetical protein FJ437_27910 [Mesorhizobium sp. B2-6-6]MCA0008794.1 hypothetical protein [Mesorhizobium sp. B264B1B]MCA0022132.1 hypothetical protein [Mesorhizobium sp. B264B1A]MCA0028600.1 hypothetical protein [Mesorhizobium sp. B263B1A]MCA0056809.1 hypothetical protein [Mesorhizobium sp. B261B1A]
MTTAVQKITLSSSRDIPFNKLVLGQSNVRRITDTMRERLTAYGLFHEIISWKLRMFVPADASGPAVPAKVIECWPVQRISEREAR